MKQVSEQNGMLTHYEITNVDKILSEIHGELFLKYRDKWNYYNKNLIASEIPLYLVLETNTYCNLKCKMCEKNFYTKDRRDISDEIIDKLVKECKEIKIPSILVGAAAESLINPNIQEILRKIKTIGAIDKFLITNGTKLDDKMSNFLIDNKFERLYVSLDAATENTYKLIRGGSLKLVEQNIEKFLEIRQEKNSKIPLIRVSFVYQKENKDELDMFLEKWKDKVDIIDVQEMRDFSNLDNLQEFEDVTYKCQAPFTTLFLDCEGNIYPCCTFYSKYFCLGNIKEMTLMEAWNCEKIKNLRKSIVEGKICKVCRNCALKV